MLFRYYDAYICHHIDGFRHAVTDGPGAEAAGRVMGASESTLIFDQLLVKEPGTSTETLWHHDITYWSVAGEQIVTLWLALDDVTDETGAVEYIKGSHR